MFFGEKSLDSLDPAFQIVLVAPTYPDNQRERPLTPPSVPCEAALWLLRARELQRAGEKATANLSSCPSWNVVVTLSLVPGRF